MKSRKLRTGDVAERAGYSVQQIRDLERGGVLPPAPRSPSGYRAYGQIHVHAALAYRALAAAIGPVEAKRLMRADTELPALLDAAHARLHRERQDLRSAQQAATAIIGEPITDVRPGDSMSITELAEALGVRASTLRHWEAEGLLTPERTVNRVRRYKPDHVRDARIVHQLRLAGHRVPALRDIMPRLRGRWSEVAGALADREADLAARSRQLIRAAAALEQLYSGGARSEPGLPYGAYILDT